MSTQQTTIETTYRDMPVTNPRKKKFRGCGCALCVAPPQQEAYSLDDSTPEPPPIPVQVEGSPLPNAILYYLNDSRDSIEMWDSYCHELAGKTSIWLAQQGVRHEILWMKPESGLLVPSNMMRQWRFHTCIEIDGFVHDAWHPIVLPRADYLKSMFPTQETVVYSGNWSMEELQLRAQWGSDFCGDRF